MTTQVITPIEAMDNDQLLDELAMVKGHLQQWSDYKSQIEHEMQARMENDGATLYVGARFTAAMEVKNTYDPALLQYLLELIPQERLTKAKAYTPEHTEVVPAKWNATKLRPFAKEGEEVRTIIEAAKVPSRPTLKIEAIPEAKGAADDNNAW